MVDVMLVATVNVYTSTAHSKLFHAGQLLGQRHLSVVELVLRVPLAAHKKLVARENSRPVDAVASGVLSVPIYRR